MNTNSMHIIFLKNQKCMYIRFVQYKHTTSMDRSIPSSVDKFVFFKSTNIKINNLINNINNIIHYNKDESCIYLFIFSSSLLVLHRRTLPYLEGNQRRSFTFLMSSFFFFSTNSLFLLFQELQISLRLDLCW